MLQGAVKICMYIKHMVNEYPEYCLIQKANLADIQSTDFGAITLCSKERRVI